MKKKRNNMIPIITILVLFICLLLTVGYSAFSDQLTITNTVGYVRIYKLVRVNGVTSNSSGVSNLNYLSESIVNTINLPASNSITYSVTVTNLGSAPVALSNVSFYNGNGAVSNLTSNISSSNYVKICNNNDCINGVSKTFDITITNSGGSTISTDLTIKLTFDEVYTVTYDDQQPEEVLAGSQYTHTFQNDAPSSLSITMGGNSLVDGTDYSYQNGTLTISNVTGNVVITPVTNTHVILEKDYFIDAARNTSFYLISKTGSTAVPTSLTNTPTWYSGNITGLRCAATDLTATYSPIWCLDIDGNLYYRYRGNSSSNYTSYNLSSYFDFSTYDYFPTVYYRSSTSYLYIVRSDGKMIRISNNGSPDGNWTYGQTVNTTFIDCASRSSYFACVDIKGDVYYQSSYSTSAWSSGYASSLDTVLNLSSKRNFNNTFISVSSEAYETIYVDGNTVYNSHTTLINSTTISANSFVQSPLPGGGIIDCVTSTDRNDRAYNICLGADKVYYYKLYSATTWNTGGSYAS